MFKTYHLKKLGVLRLQLLCGIAFNNHYAKTGLASHQRWFFRSLRLKENDAKFKVKIFIYFFCRKYIREIVCKLGNLANGSLQLNILDGANESDAVFQNGNLIDSQKFLK